MEPFSTIIGVIVGFLLSAIWEFWKDSNRDKKTGESIRTLLLQEVEHNVRSLTEVRIAYTKTLDNTGAPELVNYDGLQVAKNYQGGQLSQDAWISQMSNVHLALKPDEIVEVYKFYGHIRSTIEAVDQLHSFAPTGDRMNNHREYALAGRVIAEIYAALMAAPSLAA